VRETGKPVVDGGGVITERRVQRGTGFGSSPGFASAPLGAQHLSRMHVRSRLEDILTNLR